MQRCSESDTNGESMNIHFDHTAIGLGLSRFASIAALAVSMGIVSCDDGALAPRAESCSKFCDKLELCDDRTDLAGCEKNCGAEIVRSDEYLSARASCAAERSCNTFAQEVGVMGEDLCRGNDDCALNDCTSDTLARRTRTSTEQSYCSSLSNKLGACDTTIDTSLLGQRCLGLIATLSDEYLTEVQKCVEGTCTQVKDCLRGAADRFNTDLTPAPDSWIARTP